ncbi:MAG: NUDIX hydrolase [Lachnospiraceae bacterium]|nr:NUDIX hydrolase [Lachnospiraceae bacterium]
MEQIKRIQRTLKYKGAIVDVYSDTMQLPDGTTAEWDFVAHRKGAAAVVPVTSEGEILMVHQYRNALDRETIEIPAGARDSLTEDTKVCALRELEEETGYRAGKIEKLLSLKTTVAFCNEFIDVYLATELIPGKQNLDPEEFIDVHTYKLQELLDMIYAGTIQDSKTVAGVLAYYGKYGNRIEEKE